MPGSGFLANAKIVPAPDLGAGAPAAGVANRVPGVQMTCQEEDQWCWAAVTQSVEQWKGNVLSQSAVASDHVGPGVVPLACIYPLTTGDSGLVCTGCGHGCGDTHSLAVVLTQRGRLPSGAGVPVPPAFSDIKAAIDAQRPFPVRIKWNDTDGHFVCVVGYSVDAAGHPRVIVLDPLTPWIGAPQADEQDMSYTVFVGAYPSTGGGTGVPNYYYEVG